MFFDIKMSVNVTVNLREGDNSSSFSPSPYPEVFFYSKIVRKNQRKSNNVENCDKNGRDEQVTSKKCLKNKFLKNLLYLSVQVISKISQKKNDFLWPRQSL